MGAAGSKVRILSIVSVASARGLSNKTVSLPVYQSISTTRIRPVRC